ncbi:sel1 repeat family protein [Pseudotabrizicola sp. 4114]|uniref:tetratricopeptide repeat protein n=1 Tax=Pseudotabrizicola sp. 4114 TaxID=2817731 RepID=UPI00285EC417|nr:TPR repeat protein [Pseudorhodobacter sp. 4114]
MHLLSRLAALGLCLCAGPVLAEGESLGSLNPDEMSLERMVEDAGQGKTSMTVCASGYLMTKSGRHEAARAVFQRCAEQGYTGAMTWMSQLDDNGLGAPESPDAAANWDRRAAELGDPVGMFNLGLDMMRGRGVAQDQTAGRALIDRAAGLGLPVARRMQSAGYDLDEVTPDADSWKYAPLY